ncbi:polysaccharide biosynthesis tyrosine autokinase [Frigoribacterium sp. UYMn621]|uniref:polysaccharide biosynthesis tyrosine autokinase n=1 Tax=Frigoribacterium sp. UYMn621 TaxID=3156343 RepID=UPI0033915ABF
MDHRQFWNLVRSRWIVLIAFALVGLIGGSVYVLATPREYTAESELFVSAAGIDNTSDLAQGGAFSQQQARNYSAIATKELVLDPVISSLGLESTVAELARNVSVTVPLNTSIISIVVTDSSPGRAAGIANAIASSLVDEVVKLVPKKSDGTTPIRLEPVQNATVPAAPSAPNTRVALLLGLLAGLLVGLVLIILREIASTRVRSTEQLLEFTDAPILGTVVNDRAAARAPLLDVELESTVRAEEFRQLRTNVLALEVTDPRHAILITSSIPREGKSVTAANLAISIAATGRTVCLVDADLRTPAIATLFALDSTALGLSDVLADGIPFADALQPWGSSSLSIIQSGSVPPNASELVGSNAAVVLFSRLRQEFDFVIVDSPALLPVTDGAILANLVGGALLVVGAGRVEARELRRSLELLESADGSLVGTVFNRASARTLGRFRASYVPKSRRQSTATSSPE